MAPAGLSPHDTFVRSERYDVIVIGGGDRRAHSAYRTEACCMASGQAAGAMAVLSADRGQAPDELPMEAIRDLLTEHGAVVPEG